MNKPSLLLTIEAYRNIMAYTDTAEGEITGFADITFNAEKNQFIADKVYLIEQEAGGTHVDMSEETIAKFTLERVQDGATQLPQLWWHSHVEMDAFFSATDIETMEEFKGDSYTIALVVNKKRNMKAQLNLWKPFQYSIELPVIIQFDYEKIPDEIVEEVSQKVKEPSQVALPSSYHHSKKNESDTNDTEDEENDDDWLANGGWEEMTEAWLPQNVKEAGEFIKEKDLWVSFDKHMNEYVFYDFVERVKYKDLYGDWQDFAEVKRKEQEQDYYGRS